MLAIFLPDFSSTLTWFQGMSDLLLFNGLTVCLCADGLWPIRATWLAVACQVRLAEWMTLRGGNE